MKLQRVKAGVVRMERSRRRNKFEGKAMLMLSRAFFSRVRACGSVAPGIPGTRRGQEKQV